MQLNRRDFLKMSAPLTGMLVLGGIPKLNSLARGQQNASSSDSDKAMLYDAVICVGCRACQSACKQWNSLRAETEGEGGIYDNPRGLSGITWTMIKFIEVSENDGTEYYFRKYQCLHCTDASCELVCPTGAISHQGSAVVIDQEWCIGCGYCVQACPYDVPHKDEEEGTARKCTRCIDRTSQGLGPACVEVCPADAVIYGDRDELIAEGNRRVQALISSGKTDANLYGTTHLGGLGLLYVLPESPAVFGLPEEPQLSTGKVGLQWLSGVISAVGIAAVPFWLLFRRRKKEETKAEVE
ncbi:4Fe-4S dicluster domain-containing protein [Chloroflexota bacterium]